MDPTRTSRITASPPPKQHLASTQDLLARFHLHLAYDRYVRPTIVNTGEAGGFGAGAGTFGDKGKSRDFEMGSGEAGANVGSEVVPGIGDGEDDDGVGVKGEKKMKNNYRHLIKGLPGVFLLYLSLWIHDFQRLAIGWSKGCRPPILRLPNMSSHSALLVICYPHPYERNTDPA